MKTLLLSTLAVAGVGVSLVNATPAQAQENPRQYVVVIAEGVSPQVLDLGRAYLRKADDDADLNTSFDDLKDAGKVANASATSLAEMQGVLSLAKKQGFKTGLVTTSDLSAVAPIFYTLSGTTGDALISAQNQYDFLAGAGGANLVKAGEAVKAGKGTYIASVADLDAEITGQVLATQEGENLSYAIDRDPENQLSLSELSALAIDTLSVDNSPFVLVIHDSLTKRALEAKDSPALFEQFREVNTVVSDVLARREDNANLSVAALLTGGSVTPQWKAGADAQNSYFVLSNLTRSFAGVGQTLKGADDQTILDFSDLEAGEYRGWKLSASDRANITAGKLDPEVAVRAAYEPVINLEYAPVEAAPVVYSAGLDASNGLAAGLKAALAKPAK